MLSRYPCLREIGSDNGTEFKAEFAELCADMGLKQKPSNAWNLQSNAILERIHQVLGDFLVTFDLENTPIDPDNQVRTSLQWPMQLDHRIINHMDTHQLNLYLEEICSLQL